MPFPNFPFLSKAIKECTFFTHLRQPGHFHARSTSGSTADTKHTPHSTGDEQTKHQTCALSWVDRNVLEAAVAMGEGPACQCKEQTSTTRQPQSNTGSTRGKGKDRKRNLPKIVTDETTVTSPREFHGNSPRDPTVDR